MAYQICFGKYSRRPLNRREERVEGQVAHVLQYGPSSSSSSFHGRETPQQWHNKHWRRAWPCGASLTFLGFKKGRNRPAKEEEESFFGGARRGDRRDACFFFLFLFQSSLTASAKEAIFPLRYRTCLRCTKAHTCAKGNLPPSPPVPRIETGFFLLEASRRRH